MPRATRPPPRISLLPPPPPRSASRRRLSLRLARSPAANRQPRLVARLPHHRPRPCPSPPQRARLRRRCSPRLSAPPRGRPRESLDAGLLASCAEPVAGFPDLSSSPFLRPRQRHRTSAALLARTLVVCPAGAPPTAAGRPSPLGRDLLSPATSMPAPDHAATVAARARPEDVWCSMTQYQVLQHGLDTPEDIVDREPQGLLPGVRRTPSWNRSSQSRKTEPGGFCWTINKIYNGTP